MFIAHDYRAACRTTETALAIGNFDGLHRGHRELLSRTHEAAARRGLSSVVLTFEPHPARILAPERAPALITGLDRRLELVAATGIDCAVVQLFDRALGALEPEDFARQVLCSLRANVVFVGEDFRFGRDRAGDGNTLEALGKTLGFEVNLLPKVQEGGEAISSTRVRKSLAEGSLELAERLLGRRFDFDGVVIEGNKRGRTLGFPTANLATPVEALPRDGVYAVRARILGGAHEPAHDAVMNLGVRPTFSAGRSVEVHLLDGQHDLYGLTLRVECVRRLRDERRFDGIEALRAQLERDVAAARQTLSTEER